MTICIHIYSDSGPPKNISPAVSVRARFQRLRSFGSGDGDGEGLFPSLRSSSGDLKHAFTQTRDPGETQTPNPRERERRGQCTRCRRGRLAATRRRRPVAHAGERGRSPVVRLAPCARALRRSCPGQPQPETEPRAGPAERDPGRGTFQKGRGLPPARRPLGRPACERDRWASGRRSPARVRAAPERFGVFWDGASAWRLRLAAGAGAAAAVWCGPCGARS